MKKGLSILLLFSLTATVRAADVQNPDAEKCCNTCPTTTTSNCPTKPCCSSCGCRTELTKEEEAAGVQRCACKPPTRDVGTSDAEKCNSCNTCPTTTTTSSCPTKPCCNSCGCKTELTKEEEAAGVQRCACKPPTRTLVAKAAIAQEMTKK